MKKGIVIVLAIAIIGAVGIASKHNSSDSLSPTTSPSNASTLGTSTSNQSGSSSSSNTGSSAASSSNTYKDGTYKGASEDTPYGTVQVAAEVSGGKITNIQFINMPGPEGHSKELTAYAEPYLKDETIQKQTAQIDFVSGATTTSEGYVQSLQAALNQAV